MARHLDNIFAKCFSLNRDKSNMFYCNKNAHTRIAIKCWVGDSIEIKMKSEWAKWKLFFNMVLQPFLIDRKILAECDANKMFLLHLIMALFS